jgi:hypothetical protein
MQEIAMNVNEFLAGLSGNVEELVDQKLWHLYFIPASWGIAALNISLYLT